MAGGNLANTVVGEAEQFRRGRTTRAPYEYST